MIARRVNWLLILSSTLLAIAVVGAFALTSRAASTVGWQPVSSGLPTSGYVRDIAFGDVNNDGKPDLVVAYAGGQGMAVFASNGNGQWSSTGMATGLPTVGFYERLALGDLNNDGKLDIVASGGSNNGVSVWRGNGLGTWTAITSGLPATGTYSGVALGDINRDGRPEIFAAGIGGVAPGIKVLLNYTSYFSQTTSPATTGSYNEIAVGYVDNDGYLDLVAANNSAGIDFWRGGAGGSGWMETSTGLTTTVGFRGVALGDINGDGKLDILASRTGVSGPSGGGLFTYLWDESGNRWTYAPSQIPVAGSYAQLSLEDINNDGRLDLVAGGWPSQGTLGVHLWLGSATGFTAGPTITNTGSLPAISLADLDRNGLLDVAAGDNAGAGVKAWRNDGVSDSLGSWAAVASPQNTGSPSALALGDLNRDGYLDVVVSRPEGGLNAWKGNGGNSWSDCGLSGVGFAYTGTYESAVVGFFNRNSRYPDVIGARSDGGGINHFGNYGICYWDTVVITSSGSFRGLSAGDLDSDGNMDLVATRFNNGLRVWERAIGGWGLVGSPTTTGNYQDTALGDFNHDGKLDITAAASDGTGVKVFEYVDRAWATRSVTTTGEFYAVAVGDLNNDGHLDIVAAKNGTGSEQGIYAWQGDGTGSGWTSFPSPVSTGQYFDLDLDDFNHDGKLDILAGRDGFGVSVWAGNGQGGWSSADTNLPATGAYLSAKFGHIDRDGSVDILATKLGGGLQFWTAGEATPPTISNVQPSFWITTSKPTLTVTAIDSGSGISVTSAVYRYSTNGGASWSAYLPASSSGFNGITGTIAITAASVPFNQDSATQNLVEFKVQDVVGNIATALFTIQIDATPPTAPTSLSSSNVSAYDWTNLNMITVNWSGAADGTSGLSGYSILFDQLANTLPDTITEGFSPSYTSSALPDGDNWYAHVRTRDAAGNWSTTAKHLGPFLIDTVKPTNPDSIYSNRPTGQWITDNTIYTSWSAGEDAGSLIMGYSYVWTNSAFIIPDADMNTVSTEMTSLPLDDGVWFFHIRARDGAGNWADGASHKGPFKIDRTPPTSQVTGPKGTVSSKTFEVIWEGSDAGSGISTYYLQFRDMTTGGGWTDWAFADTGGWFTGKDGHTYQFRSRATDNEANIEAWPAYYDAEVKVATAQIMADAWALEVTQGIQDRNNSVVLIAGKPAFVRFYIFTISGHGEKVSARLKVKRDHENGAFLGYVLPGNKNLVITTKVGADRGNIDDSFWFQLPSDWLNGTLWLEAEVNPTHSLAEKDYDDNFASTTVTFKNSPTMHLSLIDMCYNFAGTTYNIESADRTAIESWLKRVYPIAKLNVTQAVMSPCYDSPPSYETALDDLKAIKAYNVDKLGEYQWKRYYGPIEDQYWRDEVGSGGGGLGVVMYQGQPGKKAASVGHAGTADNFGKGWVWEDRYSGWLAGHELGHNYGRWHTYCNDEPDLDLSYPHDFGAISPTDSENDPNAIYGFDSKLKKVYDPSMRDIMSYCKYQWISDYTYEAIFNKMVAETPGMSMISAPQNAQGEYVSVSGSVIAPYDEVTLRSIYRLTDPFNVTPPPSGDYSIRLLDASDGILADYPLSPQESEGIVSGHGVHGKAWFSEVVPWVASTTRLAIYHGDIELASRAVSAHPPAVTVISPNGGESLTGPTATVSWNASDEDGDALTYTLEYSVDGGTHWKALGTTITKTTVAIETAWLAGTMQGRLRITANDGVNTGFDDSDANFIVPSKTPKLDLFAPLGNPSYILSQTISFEAEAYDTEDGTLPDDAFVWTSNINGVLGTGRTLATAGLVTGTHTVTVTVSDSAGQQAQATTAVIVGELPPDAFAPDVQLFFQPPLAEVSVGQVFPVEVWAEAVDQPLAAIDLFLDYGPELEIVDPMGNPVTSGAFFTSTAMPALNYDLVDKEKREAAFAIGIQAGANPVTGTFLLGTLRFRAKAASASPGTLIRFHESGNPGDPRNTLAVDPDGNMVDIVLQAAMVQATGATLTGWVQLQSRGDSPSSSWVVPLTLTLYAPGVVTPTYVFNSITDPTGRFTVTGVAPNTYDFKAKKSHSLTSKLPNFTIGTGNYSLYFGTLLEGDANGDGLINSLDYALLATAYFKAFGQPGFEERADFNGDGRINARDYAPLAANYFKHSDIQP